MSVERSKTSIFFHCDECGDSTESTTRNFSEAVQEIKDENWKTYNHNGEWKHFCGTSHMDRWLKKMRAARGF